MRALFASARHGRALAAAVAAPVLAVAITAVTAGCTAHPAAAPAALGGAARCAAELAVSHPQAPPPVDPDLPVLGFDPYNTFGTNFNQGLIVAVVRAMAANGMQAAGYRYIILDDGWQGGRSARGQLTSNPARFPCGMTKLAAFVHASGFRFGLYTSPAPKACSGRTGSGGHVTADARAFASWGVDYVKLDWCGSDYSPADAAAIARTWRAAMNATQRTIILSINAGGSPSVGPWAHQIVNSWRVGGDICGSWYNLTQPPARTARHCYNQLYDEGIYDYLTSPGLQQQVALTSPGHYIDPDTLEVGTAAESPSGKDLPSYALTPAVAGTNFAMWAMWSAPLIAGNDPRSMTGSDLASTVLLNRLLIAIDQDPLGRAARLLLSGAGYQVWRKQLAGGRVAVAVANLASAPMATSFSWLELGFATPPASALDVWADRMISVNPDGLAVEAAPHGTAVYELTPG